MKTFIGKVDRDGKDLVLVFPKQLLRSLNLQEGEFLQWDLREDGSVMMTRAGQKPKPDSA